MFDGYFRVAAAVPSVQPADVVYNTASIIEMIKGLDPGIDLVVFPELCVTGYTCGDLFHNHTLLDAVPDALGRICEATSAPGSPLVIIGAPLRHNGALYNCAVAVRGRLLAIVPKTYVPNYNEFYEKRWWASAPDTQELWMAPDGSSVPLGTHTLLEVSGVRIGIEICEDLWTPSPPSTFAAMAGAQVIVNLSASDDLIGKYAYINKLISQQSARCICAYVYASR